MTVSMSVEDEYRLPVHHKDGSGRELTVEDAGRRRGGRQCGLCSLVARAFRRAVCGAPSRRGSGESYQELTAPLAEDEKKTEGVSINITEQNAVYIKMVGKY
ncbi:hypothetical protein Zmor_005722 [Zophobas morio]|uniref:Uncharacterized protein n=1 Tax=Zophobas morio TaxID=2755281 RepID=A0AA38ITT1_9CUCU|nr:hypothetical protein Zmor_005722 [Zophobas morio]